MGRTKSKKEKPYLNSNCYLPNTENQWGSIFKSMLTHERFKELPPTAKYLYCCCRVHSQSKEMKQNLYQYKKELVKLYGLNEESELINLGVHDKVFLFPAKHGEMYGFEKHNLSKYLKILRNKGFISVIICGQKQKKENLYAFSSKWMEETKQNPSINNST